MNATPEPSSASIFPPPATPRDELPRTYLPLFEPRAEEEVKFFSPNPTIPSGSHSDRKRRRPKRPQVEAKRKGVRRRETVLYRYYDAEDVLLYVGISANMPARLGSHETDSTWMDFAARSTLEHFGDRADAEKAEQAAIEADRPLFNILHNDRPDRVRRLVDYLIDRDRRDLLVPLISRG